jgi:hypothetical protein
MFIFLVSSKQCACVILSPVAFPALQYFSILSYKQKLSRYSELAAGWTVRGSNLGGGRDFMHLSRPVLGPTQPPAQWVPGLSRE